MQICAIWIQRDDELWLETAWDRITVDDHNPEGFNMAFLNAVKEHGVDNVRKQIINVPLDSVEKLFKVPMVNADDSRDQKAKDIIDPYLGNGQKIQAIKEIRGEFGIGLREAKGLVDHYIAKDKMLWPGDSKFNDWMDRHR